MSKKLLFILLMVMSITIYSQETAMEIEPNGTVSVKTRLTNRSGKTYDALPVGTILMFSGKDWVDNSSIPGWYACTLEANGNKKVVAGIEVPNLESSFIMGTTPEDLNQTTPVRTGGKNELEAKDLPKHAHEIDHGHGTAYGTTYDSPSRAGGDGYHAHTSYYFHDRGGSSRMMANQLQSAGGDEKPIPVTTSYTTHTHDVLVSIPTLSSNAANTKFIDDNSNQDYTSGSIGDNLKMDNRPKYYTVIYIMKVTYQ